MEASRRIILYGNSVILGAIGAALRRCPRFEVVSQAPAPQPATALKKGNRDVLLFDLEAPHTESVFSLLKADPTVLLIGVGPGVNLVDIWSSRELRDISMPDLVGLLEDRIDDLSTVPGGAEGRPSFRG